MEKQTQTKNKKQTKRNILKLDLYTNYAYTEIWKNAKIEIEKVVEKKQATDFDCYIFTKPATKIVDKVASLVFTQPLYEKYSQLSQNTLKKYCDNALKHCIKFDIYTDLHTLKSDKKLLYFESRFNLNSFMYQLAIEILTNGETQPIEK